MGLFDFFNRKKKLLPQETAAAPAGTFETAGDDITEQLNTLGYFKYAHAADVEDLKAAVRRSLTNDHILSTIWNEEKPYNAKCRRHYGLDNETLFEEGGFTDYMKDFDHLFKAIGFACVVTNHMEEWDAENGLNHSITINGKDYLIFRNFEGYGWGEAPQRFAEILNDQLILQQKEERIYLSSAGNDGQAIVLTEAQFNLLDPILKPPTERPLRLADWCRVMQVDPAKYKG